MVTTIKLNIDPQVKKELRELADFQDKDSNNKTLKDQVTNQPAEVQEGRYAVVDGVIHCKNHKGYLFLRPMLSSSLENKVIKFVHLSLGHAGSEKCIAEIAHTFYVKNLGKKVMKILSCCDVCQRVNNQTGLKKLRAEAIYQKSQGTYAPWIFMTSSQLGTAVYGTF